MSSSDGQRFPVAVKTRNATPNPRYFGYGKGLTFYSWTSDQFSQYGSKVIPATVRDATYVLDAILDNETELEILEHTTDTAGYTELVFALFDLLGMQFSPRIRDLGDQRIYRADKNQRYKLLWPVFSSTIREERILPLWDDVLRVAASIKLGWVTASLFISKLQSYPRQNRLMKALVGYGQLIKSTYIPRYLCDPQLQRRVGRQLNKGEAIHDLRHFLMFANEGKIRKAQLEDQANQAAALTLVTNAIIVWNTRYIQAIIDKLKEEGHQVRHTGLRLRRSRVSSKVTSPTFRLVGSCISTNTGSTSSMSKENEIENN
jgi:TnpA family transposase